MKSRFRSADKTPPPTKSSLHVSVPSSAGSGTKRSRTNPVGKRQKSARISPSSVSGRLRNSGAPIASDSSVSDVFHFDELSGCSVKRDAQTNRSAGEKATSVVEQSMTFIRENLQNGNSKRSKVASSVQDTCLSIRKTRSLRWCKNRREIELGDIYEPKTFSVPLLGQKKKKHHSSPVMHNDLDEEFIKNQKAYYSEIDAYKLEEEEVSEYELV